MFKETTIKDMRATFNQMSEDKCIVIVVDELDRCFPEYLIKVLERLYHLFSDIENI